MDIFSANEVAIFCSVGLLRYSRYVVHITETIEVTEVCGQFLQCLHVGQPCSEDPSAPDDEGTMFLPNLGSH